MLTIDVFQKSDQTTNYLSTKSHSIIDVKHSYSTCTYFLPPKESFAVEGASLTHTFCLHHNCNSDNSKSGLPTRKLDNSHPRQRTFLLLYTTDFEAGPIKIQ